MELTFAVIFVAIAIVIIIFDLYFAARSYREFTVAGKYLGRAAVLASLVIGTYLVSILCRDYFAASMMCSLYFLLIDWMLLTLLQFVIILSKRVPLEKDIPLMWVLRGVAVADSIVMLINPFHEIAIRYIPITSIIAHFQYEKHLLFNLHLVFTYILVLGVVGILIRRILHTPQRYRNQYIFIVASILLIVAVNAVFILPEKTSLYTLLDYSIIGYSVALLLMYWSCFSYSRTYMLEGLSKSIFDNVNQGIILFDYMNFMVMYNQRLCEIFPQITLERDMPMDSFLDQSEIPPDEIEDKTACSIQLFARKGDQRLPVRCEYRRMLDEEGKVLGQLFVFSDDSGELDLLTGFQSWDHFCRLARSDAGMFRPPYAVAVFDINALGSINRRLGKDIGDRRIHELAERIRREMPDDALLVRAYDANLVAVCRGKGEEDLMDAAKRVTEASAGQVQMGLASPGDDFDGILQVIDRAIQAMSNRKLLDPESARSQSLTSLVRALKESDSDTESHVHRTETMGCELGRRLHLNDLQMTQLSLLCLLHDIGKIGIPLELLNKPGRLTGEEWAVMQTHVEKGYQIAISSHELQDIAEMIRAHHERWDGHGYLRKMEEEEIPVLSRIIAIVDSYDAMVNDRVYRSASTVEAAKAEIRRCSGSQFDPTIAAEFLNMLDEMPWIAEGELTDGSRVAILRPASAAAGTASEDDAAGPSEDAAKAGPDEEQAPSHTFAVRYSRYQLDVDNQIIETDDRFEDMTGYSREDIRRLDLAQADLIDEGDRFEYFLKVDSQMAQGDIIYIEHDILRKDGGHIHVYCCGRRYFDAVSKTIHSDVIIVDADSTHHGKLKTGSTADPVL